MTLLTEEEERIAQVQDWACDIFTRPSKRKKVRQSASDATSGWPLPSQATAAVAAALDSGPCKRRATQAHRSAIRESLAWAGSAEGGNMSCQLANIAVLAHVPLTAIGFLTETATLHVGLWAAIRSGRLCGSVALRLPKALLVAYGRTADALVSDSERSAWTKWKAGEPCEEKGWRLSEGPAARSEANEEETKVLAAIGTRNATAATPKASPKPAHEALGMEGLRSYQRAAFEAIKAAFPDNCCAVLPCGAGKTKLGAAIAHDFISEQGPARANDRFVLVLCMRREGARQWSQELRKSWRTKAIEADAGRLRSELFSANAPRIALATYARVLSDWRRVAGSSESINSGSRSFGVLADRLLAAGGGLIVADECHMVPAPRIGALLQQLMGPSRRVVGLTATLLREGMSIFGGVAAADATNADESVASLPEVPWPILGRCVFKETFANLAPEYLAPIRCVEVRVPVVAPWVSLFRTRPLASAICLSRGKWEALECLLAMHASESLLIVVERCEQARLIAATFGILPVDGSVPATQLREYFERFRRGQIQCMVATHVLDDSADFPELCVMIQMGGFFKSRRQEQQRLGRLLRWGPQKRRRWESEGTRPCFYVLVHEDTLEEEMSLHRTSSVTGVEYERITLADLKSNSPSSLVETNLFPSETSAAVSKAGKSFAALATYAAQAADFLESMERTCFEMSERIFTSLSSGGSFEDRAARLESVRAWLKGRELGIVDALLECGDDDPLFEDEHENAREDVSTSASALNREHARNRSRQKARTAPQAQVSMPTSPTSSSSSSYYSSSDSTYSDASPRGALQPSKAERKAASDVYAPGLACSSARRHARPAAGEAIGVIESKSRGVVERKSAAYSVRNPVSLPAPVTSKSSISFETSQSAALSTDAPAARGVAPREAFTKLFRVPRAATSSAIDLD